MVKHRSRGVVEDPTQLNWRQVHLIHEAVARRTRGSGSTVAPGDIGENVTTRGIDLLALPVDTELLTLGRRPSSG